MEKNIANYAKDGSLMELSDGKRCEWCKMIDAVKALGRPLMDQEIVDLSNRKLGGVNSS